jgi:carboxymethylenebutenolidase
MTLTNSHLSIDVDGHAMDAFLSVPEMEAPRPAVAIIHDILGLSEHTEDVATRFAEHGYVAIAPNLFWSVGQIPDFTDRASFMRFRQSIDERLMYASMDATLDYLRDHPFLDKVHVGIVGFCWGGAQALLEAAHNPSLAACVDFYGGGMVREHTELQPISPMEAAKELRVPFLGLFGEDDQSIPVEQVYQLEGILKQTGVPYEIEIYPHAGHAFFSDQQATYREHAATDAWKRVLAFYAKYLKGQTPA